MKHTLILFFTLLLFACGTKHSEDLEKVEVLQAKLAALENTFNTVDLQEAKKAREAYNENMKKIKTFYYPDTLDHNFTSMLNAYKGIKHTTGTLDFDYQSNKDNIELMKKQLGDLHVDIENGVLPTDSITIFIQQESLNMEQLSENVGTYVLNAENAVGLHDTLSQKIADYIKPYETKF